MTQVLGPQQSSKSKAPSLLNGLKSDSGEEAPAGSDSFYQAGMRRQSLANELLLKRTEIKDHGLLYFVLAEVARIERVTALPLIVEFGSGNATNLALIREIAPSSRLVGVDIYQPPAADQFPFVEYLQPDREASIFPASLNGSVSLVLMIEVIEHLWDPDSTLQQVLRLLRPGGWLIVTTPNLSSALNRLALLFGFQPLATEVSTRRTFGKPGQHAIAGHIRNYTFRSLTEFISFYGFKIDAAYSVAMNYSDKATYGSVNARVTRALTIVDRSAVEFGRTLGSRSIVVARK